jgi:hypothetical protein
MSMAATTLDKLPDHLRAMGLWCLWCSEHSTFVKFEVWARYTHDANTLVALHDYISYQHANPDPQVYSDSNGGKENENSDATTADHEAAA